jgi:hypothetical protein
MGGGNEGYKIKYKRKEIYEVFFLENNKVKQLERGGRYSNHLNVLLVSLTRVYEAFRILLKTKQSLGESNMTNQTPQSNEYNRDKNSPEGLFEEFILWQEFVDNYRTFATEIECDVKRIQELFIEDK